LRRRCRSGGDDRKIILWDAQKGERLMELNGHINAVAFSFDGKVLASGGHDRKIILWDPNKGERLTELKGHRLAQLFFSVSPGQRGRGVEDLDIYVL
jgi:WD40 repeat protein